jgi:hypothetical protein
MRIEGMPTKAALQQGFDREVESFTTVFEEGNYSKSQIKQVIRLIHEGLNDAEWSNLRGRYGLPDEARLHIRETVFGYWDFRIDQSISKKLPGKVDGVINQLRKLNEALGELRIDRDFFKGVYAYYERSPMEQAELIDHALTSLQEVDRLLVEARVRIKGPSSRPTHRGLWHGIDILRTRMLAWGHEFTVDQQRFAYEIFHLADAKVTQRGFNSVFAQYLLIFPKWNSTALWTEHTHR